MKKILPLAFILTALFLVMLTTCTKPSIPEEAKASFVPDETILKAIGDDELLNKIYMQTGFYYCPETTQLMFIKLDNTDKGIQNESFQEENLNLYTILYGLNSNGKVFKKESASTPIESIKKIKSVYANLQKTFEFSENGAMFYIDNHGKKFEKYKAGIADDEQLYSELKKLFQNRFDLYLGSYHSDKYDKDYTLSKNGNKYTLEVQDKNNNIIKDFYEFDTKASLLGTEEKYYIRVDKERDSFQITEYIDYSQYPEYDEMTNSDEYKDIIKQETVQFKLTDKK